MNAYEWLFEIDGKFDAALLGVKKLFYTVDPDNHLIGLEVKKYFQDSKDLGSTDSLLEVCLDMDEEEFFYVRDACGFIPYEKFEFLKSVYVEGDILQLGEPCQRNQLVCIRGTCDQRCFNCIPKYDGYALRQIPSCNGQLVGTSVWTSKWATTIDVLQDTFQWIKYCKGLNVLIINFDFTPWEMSPDFNFGYICFAAQIRGNNVRFITNPKERKKLFEDYSLKYECTDYEIEKSISDSESGWQFSFLKP